MFFLGSLAGFFGLFPLLLRGFTLFLLGLLFIHPLFLCAGFGILHFLFDLGAAIGATLLYARKHFGVLALKALIKATRAKVFGYLFQNAWLGAFIVRNKT